MTSRRSGGSHEGVTGSIGPAISGHSALARLFTPEVVARLGQVRRPPTSRWDEAGRLIRQRHTILGPEATPRTPRQIAWRETWARYLDAADACGLLAATDLGARLVDTDDDNFRGALAECLAAWFLTNMLGITVEPNPDDHQRRNADLRARIGGLRLLVEVKAPFVPVTNSVFSGDDPADIVRCIKAAGRQFQKGCANLLVLVPTLRTPLSMDRGQLVGAAIGHEGRVFSVSLVPDVDPPPPEPFFLQDGKLAKRYPCKTGGFTSDFTRVGAVMSIEEQLVPGEDQLRVDHVALVVHNPFAAVPIRPATFGSMAQFVFDGPAMHWRETDRSRAASDEEP